MEKIMVPDLDAWRSRSVEEIEEAEEKKRGCIKTTACEVACGLHLAAGVGMVLFVDLVEQLPLFLMAIVYCFFAGTFFGIAASAGETEE